MPPPTTPPVTISFFSIFKSLFCFVPLPGFILFLLPFPCVHLFCVLKSSYEWSHVIFVFLWLISLSMISSSSTGYKFLIRYFKQIFSQGALVAQSVKCLTPGFGSGHDFVVWDQAPHQILGWQCGACLGFFLSPSLSALPPLLENIFFSPNLWLVFSFLQQCLLKTTRS